MVAADAEDIGDHCRLASFLSQSSGCRNYRHFRHLELISVSSGKHEAIAVDPRKIGRRMSKMVTAEHGTDLGRS